VVPLRVLADFPVCPIAFASSPSSPDFCNSHDIMLKVPLRAILDPTAAMADATTLKRKRKASKSDPRDAPGAVVHALAHYVLGKASARHTFGTGTTIKQTFVAWLWRNSIVRRMEQNVISGV
jgi:hypothetical protein